MSETKYTIDDDVEPGSDVLIVTQESDAPVGRIYGFDHFPCFDPDEKSPAEAHAETVALADRFVSCVNNLAGLNPEGVPDLVAAMPTVPHPGGRLIKVVAHYEDGSTQTIDGEVILAALQKARQ